MQLAENSVVADRFKLARMIGRGGMGSVWQATDLRLSTVCAVKFIEGEMANMAEAQSRFQREAQAAAQLRSPHVVQIFDHGVWQGHPYIAMELLDGEDLGKRIATNHGKLPAGVVNAVVQQVCRALSKAHVAGVVHRDLKPDNIFLVTDDDREIVKILDFGVAKSASQAIDGSNTKTGAMLGTPYYMSPEQAQGIKSVDSRSDLWSLAVIVFQCMTGRLPFESEALGDLLVKIIVNPIPQPSAYDNTLTPAFDQWWAKAADRNPDNRFQTAKAFAESLSLALGETAAGDHDRTRLMRQMGGHTAVMPDGMMAGTPMPGAHTAAMITPNPQMQTPQGMPAPPFMQTPPGHPQRHHAAPAAGPPMMTPQHAPQYAAVATGSPTTGTFNGIEPSSALPKKGAPVALIVGGLLLALVGMGLGGAAVLKGRAHTNDPPAHLEPSAVAANSGESTGSTPPPPSETATATPEPPPAEIAAAAPSASASVAAVPSAPGGAAASGGGAHRPQPVPVAAKTGSASTKIPTAATPSVVAPAASKEKPINLGF